MCSIYPLYVASTLDLSFQRTKSRRYDWDGIVANTISQVSTPGPRECEVGLKAFRTPIIDSAHLPQKAKTAGLLLYIVVDSAVKRLI